MMSLYAFLCWRSIPNSLVLYTHNVQMLLKSGRNADAQCVRDARLLFEDLLELAWLQPPTERTRESNHSIGRRIR